ncbi:MAG: DNA repair protein RecO [Candidatus Marinimicrobia bacterium]|jgi:DNA repair protein RecO (recombination protein O)|nr:DNA repair protein RecO [Candidatus Neomarinimicrobiota bacterium]MDP6456790.1 DNA repair protein RecO [Candidatus Neomarinimicrobiota bacterium]MDP6593871.1 DNA repair protein RecO [Candidatus Neomarinimicrobiota bacterium]MDP6835892.1 DNA repair protein RecO [Candidatus Neomarinimicrobiota bacterium]MDP6966726.1 DNA repair protein RecO [Candidatus Neomarinimicrobiota bacterium]|tara:strand:+ start:340 stop:1089 length:750 start_codon:yes stop_codon:yes gene_type:complete
MALEKTKAVVLKSFPYGDTSKIARIYTREFGKISVIGKGIRKSKVLQSGYLEPLNYLNLIFYHNTKRQLQIFSKAEYIETWSSLKKDFRKMSYGFAVAELTDKAVTGVEPHEELFQLIVDVLKSINSVDGNMNLLFWYFEIHLLSHMGFHPSLSKCPRCSVKFDHGRFSLEYGELVCDKCNGDMGTPISARALGILRNIQHGTLEDVISIVPRKGDRQEIGHFLIEYMRYHIEGLREVKSLKVMEKVFS